MYGGVLKIGDMGTACVNPTITFNIGGEPIYRLPGNIIEQQCFCQQIAPGTPPSLQRISNSGYETSVWHADEATLTGTCGAQGNPSVYDWGVGEIGGQGDYCYWDSTNGYTCTGGPGGSLGHFSGYVDCYTQIPTFIWESQPGFSCADAGFTCHN